jgi:2,4-dienoyl-CoA reductase-like NADH-dependent reductase (Old Yellow Enzyme family)
MAHPKRLFTPLKIMSIEFKNRIWVSPMCQYSSENGHPTDWHLVHLGSRAVGGAGLIMFEATGVSPEARISPDDCGIWLDEHILSFKRVTDFIRAQGAVAGVQLAHAGRKGSTSAPWLGQKVLSEKDRGWQTIGPSAIAFDSADAPPTAMTKEDIRKVISDFEKATARSLKAGFEVLEIHMAHGYLMHEFLSPLSNQRNDQYGGSLENRMRFALEVATAVRKKWPQDLPLFVRISATDWQNTLNEPAWTLEESIVFCRELKKLGIDLIDCSSGGTLTHPEIPIGPGYQVPFAEAIRREVNIMTAAVGMITNAVQAESILLQHQADALFIAREFLRDPYLPAHMAREMGLKIDRPKQYGRAE